MPGQKLWEFWMRRKCFLHHSSLRFIQCWMNAILILALRFERTINGTETFILMNLST